MTSAGWQLRVLCNLWWGGKHLSPIRPSQGKVISVSFVLHSHCWFVSEGSSVKLRWAISPWPACQEPKQTGGSCFMELIVEKKKARREVSGRDIKVARVCEQLNQSRTFFAFWISLLLYMQDWKFPCCHAEHLKNYAVWCASGASRSEVVQTHTAHVTHPECVRFFWHTNSWSTGEVWCTGTVQLKSECMVILCQSHLVS